jgi:hypothetical protein
MSKRPIEYTSGASSSDSRRARIQDDYTSLPGDVFEKVLDHLIKGLVSPRFNVKRTSECDIYNAITVKAAGNKVEMDRYFQYVLEHRYQSPVVVDLSDTHRGLWWKLQYGEQFININWMVIRQIRQESVYHGRVVMGSKFPSTIEIRFTFRDKPTLSLEGVYGIRRVGNMYKCIESDYVFFDIIPPNSLLIYIKPRNKIYRWEDVLRMRSCLFYIRSTICSDEESNGVVRVFINPDDLLTPGSMNAFNDDPRKVLLENPLEFALPFAPH